MMRSHDFKKMDDLFIEMKYENRVFVSFTIGRDRKIGDFSFDLFF